MFSWENYHQDMIDSIRMDCSKEDIKSDPEARKLIRKVNYQGRLIKKIIKLERKVRGLK